MHARVTLSQAIRAQHLLAAAAHRRWVAWQIILLPWLQKDKDELRNVLQADKLPNIMLEQLAPHNYVMIRLALRVLGKPAFPLDENKIATYHAGIFRHWANYVLEAKPEDIERWKLQCRVPFLELSPSGQMSDYHQAIKDFSAVAEAGGFVLPNPLPQAKPRSSLRLWLLRLGHAAGIHGDYVASEAPWSQMCQGCHAEWAIARPML